MVYYALMDLGTYLYIVKKQLLFEHFNECVLYMRGLSLFKQITPYNMDLLLSKYLHVKYVTLYAIIKEQSWH